LLVMAIVAVAGVIMFLAARRGSETGPASAPREP
jgi:hypothetical protein